MILTAFADDLTAKQTEALTNVSIRSVNSIFIKLRQLLAHHCEIDWESLDIENKDELKVSRTAVERQCEIEGHKILVLVLNEYRNHIYLEIAEDARKNRKSGTGKKQAGQIISGASGQPQRNEFWIYLENRLQKFRGIAAQTFYLHIKETEFRFNNQGRLLDRLKIILQQHPL